MKVKKNQEIALAKNGLLGIKRTRLHLGLILAKIGQIHKYHHYPLWDPKLAKCNTFSLQTDTGLSLFHDFPAKLNGTSNKARVVRVSY